MAYKDEYEVARLYSDGAFVKQVNNELGGEHLRFHVHLAPPLLARRDKATGEPRKMTFGPWIFPLFGLLAKFKFLRGTAFDPFGYSTERKTERALVPTTRRCSRRCWASSPPTTITSRSGLRPFRRKSAASATSSCATSRPPRRTKGRCSISSAPEARRCSRRRNSAALAGGVLLRWPVRTGAHAVRVHAAPGHVFTV